MRTTRLVLLALILTVPALAAGDHYWELGVGCYYGGTAGVTELDVARYDWLYLCFGNIGANEETVAQLNRLLEINPRLKIVIRVWPIMGKGDCPENRYQATFLHYLYGEGVRERVDQSIRDQVSVVLDNISRPENVVGLTFLEELPGHFSGNPFRKNQTGGELTWDLKRFQSEIEAERGKPLVWDDETRLWWGRKWVEAINSIHAVMKEASNGRLIWYYQQTNHTSLDMVPEGTPLDTKFLMPIHWSDIIKPGLCDGFFAYPNSRKVWDRYLKLARENDWLFFSQVSHPGGMRLCAWDECLEMATERVPQNMGYFLYCPGDCAARRAWNDDPDIPEGAEWNTRGVSRALHWRLILGRQNVGMDVIRAQPAVRLQADLPLDGARPGGMMHVQAVVENAREASFYPDPDEAVAKGVTVTISPPAGFTVDPAASAPAKLPLGDMQPGERRIADWWLAVAGDYAGSPAGPFVITASADDSPPARLEMTEDTTVPFARPHETGISGYRWLEAPFRLPAPQVRPAIEVTALRESVRNPSVGDEAARVTFDGVLEGGARLVMDPEKGSRMFVLPLVDDDGSSRADADDPTGFMGVSDGYLVHRIRVGRPVTPGVPLLLTIAGKVASGEQNHTILRFKTTDGQRDLGALTNRLREQWTEVSGEVTPPEGSVSLEWVYLYRLKKQGTVWYGPVKVERTDVPPEGKDVSRLVRGVFPTLRKGALHTFSYRDDEVSTVRPRVRVRLIVPEAP
ncbi:MAG: hypothetical protein J7M38_10355 [Armatimonadetes bacterium]|nr:hypothetical protein [Armatimonadota bacterium]